MARDRKQDNCVSRRHFLQGIVSGSVATILASNSAARSAETESLGNADTRIQFRRSSLPILRSGEVVIVGGSFAAIAAALEFARVGQKVVLIEQRTYLGREVTATLRPWLNLGKLVSNDRVPEPVAVFLDAMGIDPVSGGIPLKLDVVKLSLENLLLDASVELIYASQPIEVLVEDKTVIGLVIGNKSGRQAVLGKVIVDATETAAVARAAGAEFETNIPEVFCFNRTIEFTDVHPIQETSLSVPKKIAIAGNEVTIHRGYRGEDHIYVEYPMVLRHGNMDLAGSMHREIEARHRGMRLASYLMYNVPQFKKAFLAASSNELHGRYCTRLAGPPPDWASDFDSVRVSLTGKNLDSVRLSISSFAGPIRLLWCLQEATRLKPSQMELIRDPVSAALLGAAFAKSLIAQRDRIGSFQSPGDSTHDSGRSKPLSRPIEVKEPLSPQRGRLYEEQVVPSSEVPVIRTVDVLVVGGGTSGATAAITSAREGMHTVLLELNPGLGGTGTLGGIDNYWFGRRIGFCARVEQVVEDVHKSINYQGATSGWRKKHNSWNIEAKMYALLKEAERVGVEVFFNAVTIGAVVEENQVRGVIVATKFGAFAVTAKVVIDTTGDGDVPAFAGAKYIYGSARDNVPMWFALAQFVKPGLNRNSFTSTVDVSNIEDYTRAILAGRRRGTDCHDHGVYIASRETRHIQGGVVLTLTDQLRRKRWPDVVNIHYSNCDIKGKCASDWIRAGLIPPNLQVEISYRALLPQGLENILVAGKAISATHDALAAIRMQADLENLGGVVALAAAQAVREGVSPRRVNLAVLQKRLVEMRLLPEKVLRRKIEQKSYDDAELKALVESLDAEKPLYSYSDMEIGEVFRERIPFVEVCTAGPQILPILERALLLAEGNRRVLLAQALAMYGSSAGVPRLIGKIEQCLVDGTLPPRTSRIRWAGLPPDQGAMPDVVYLIYSLGMTRDKRSLAVWDKVADLLCPTENDFKDPFKGTFHYVDAVCYGAELLGDTEAIPILNRIHAHACLRNLVVKNEFQHDFVHERRALLELGIGRALARCGSPTGASILISYLDDNRAILAEFAHTTLVAIAGRDYGKDVRAWSIWSKQFFPKERA